MFRLSEAVISREELVASVQSQRAGALVVFEGWVRNHNEGKRVASLEYQVYAALAEKEGAKILAEAREKFHLEAVGCVHRFGHLHLGEAAVMVAATAAHRDDAFRAARYVIDEIKHRLPVWKKEHYVDQPAEWVFCRHHHTHVHFAESDYYTKQAKVAEQEKLKHARVLVVGAGGLGCPVLTVLTAAGVGEIEVVDFDRISISNIHRQPLYSPELVGEKKVEIARARMASLNPFIRVIATDARVTPKNARELVRGRTVVLDCTDNVETKLLLHDVCLAERVPLVAASIYQFEGQVRTLLPGGAHGCFRCAYEAVPDDALLGNCNDFGVLGASVAVFGALQANEALLYLLNGSNSTVSATFFFDLRSLASLRVKNTRREGCAHCAGTAAIELSALELDPAELDDTCELVDIRDRDDSFLDAWHGSERKVVVACHRGVRSKRLVRELRAKGHSQFYSLRGGSCSQ